MNYRDKKYKWNPKAYLWQIAICASIIGGSFFNVHIYTIFISAWIGWTLRNAWEHSKLLPVQMGNIVISGIIGSFVLGITQF